MLLHRTPAEVTAHYFQGAHLALHVPASVPLQVDGSAVKLKDYLDSRGCQTLQQAGDRAAVLVTYRFDALPRALQVAIPRDYDDTLFQQKQDLETPQPADGDLREDEQPGQSEVQELVKALGEQGRTVKVLGVSPLAESENTTIIAGNSSSRKTGEVQLVAIRIDEQAMIVDRTGRVVAPALVSNVEEARRSSLLARKRSVG